MLSKNTISHSKTRVVLVSRVWVRKVEVAVGFRPFASFSCGTGEIESKVNQMIIDRSEGKGPPAKWIVMETGLGTLVGVCAYFRRPLTYDILPTVKSASALNTTITIPNAAYIYVIAVKEEFRDRALPGGATPGSFLLSGTQGYIKRDWNGRMPWTWAYSEDANKTAHGFFHSHGFGHVPPQSEEEDWKHIRDPTRPFVDPPGSLPPWRTHQFGLA
jgi:hypothetical protein